jgi:hypothetical protein
MSPRHPLGTGKEIRAFACALDTRYKSKRLSLGDLRRRKSHQTDHGKHHPFDYLLYQELCCPVHAAGKTQTNELRPTEHYCWDPLVRGIIPPALRSRGEPDSGTRKDTTRHMPTFILNMTPPKARRSRRKNQKSVTPIQLSCPICLILTYESLDLTVRQNRYLHCVL